MSDPLNCNIFNSDGDNDITFTRNDIEYCKLREDGTVRLLEFPTNGGVSANQLYGNYFNNRSFGWDTIFQGSNTTSDGRVEYMRYDFTNEVIQLPKKLLVNGGDGKTEIYESTEATNNVFRIWNKETTNTPVIHLGAGATSNDMVLSSSGFTFNKAVSCAVGFSVADNFTLTYNKKIIWGVNSIVETSSPTVPITRFDAPNTGSAYWFFVGPAVNDAYRIFTISNTEVLSKRVFKCNNIDSENNSDLVFKRNGNEYMRLDQSEDEVVVSKKLRLAGGEGKMVIWENTESTNNVVRLWNNEQTLTAVLDLGVGTNGTQIRLQPNKVLINSADLWVNTINSNGNNILIFQQNEATILTYDKDDANYTTGIFKFDKDVSVRTDKFLQCQTLRAHIFDTHPTLQTGDNDISFRYAGATYMFYDKSLSNLQMRTDINSTNDITCVALTQTSDRRLKEDIQSITTNCSNIVKKVDVRKYKFINDKEEKTNLVFIADEVEEAIPKEFTNIVNSKNEYKSLNYSNMNCILWKALQEQMVVIDKMNKKITKLEKEVKELKK